MLTHPPPPLSPQLPLSLLKAAQSQPVLVELKTGDTYNGTLDTLDNFMNLRLKDVVCTSKDGDKFWQMAEVREHPGVG